MICAQDREEAAPILVSIAYDLWSEDVIAIQLYLFKIFKQLPC